MANCCAQLWGNIVVLYDEDCRPVLTRPQSIVCHCKEYLGLQTQGVCRDIIYHLLPLCPLPCLFYFQQIPLNNPPWYPGRRGIGWSRFHNSSVQVTGSAYPKRIDTYRKCFTKEWFQKRERVLMSTFDSWQDMDKIVVLVSLTRSNAGDHIGFLEDMRRLKIATSLESHSRITVGDSSTVCDLKIIGTLLLEAHRQMPWTMFLTLKTNS